jgi:hydroxymethylpyrimidine pyrophosphatase-like HAD family hydrolase
MLARRFSFSISKRMVKICMEDVCKSIQLIVIDIDGTLLNPDGKITTRTRLAIQTAQQAGIVVTLATARRFHNTAGIAAELGLDGALIVYDGAMVVQHPQNVVISTRTLAADIAQQAVDVLERHHIQPVVHPPTGLDEQIWTGLPEFDNLWLEAYFSTYPLQTHRMPYSSLCAGHPGPLRVVAFDDEEIIQRALPDIKLLDCSWTTIKRGSFGCAELAIMDRGCSKASAMTALAGTLHIPMQAVMALGDNNNDIEMLQAAGWGVAMGQAPAAVQAIANAVTASNAEDGAAQAIEYYALSRDLHSDSNSRKRAICR